VRLAALTLSAFLAAGVLGADTTGLREAVRKAADYHRRGLYADAETAVAEALALLENKGGPPDFDIAASLNDLAALAYAQGQLDRAEQLFQRSREAYETLVGPEDTRLAGVLYNLAGVFVEQGRYAQAEPLYRASLLGAASWNNLGFLYLQQRKYEEAASWLEKALAVWEKSDTPYAAVALNNLAMLRRLQGSYDTAESLYKRALAVEEKVFGPDHPEGATTLMSLAALYRATGKGGLAIETYRQALAVLEKTLGAQDPLVIEVQAQLNELTRK
jgi:tetratricopeptide (TPR) repeat protein